MTRVTGYKCIFQTNHERFKFALTLAGEGAGDADFVVADPEAAETLLDMFDDSSEAHFDAEAGELTFSFSQLELVTEEEDEDEAETDETDSAAEEDEEDADSEAEEGDEEREQAEEGKTDAEAEESGETAKRAAKQRSRRSAA